MDNNYSNINNRLKMHYFKISVNKQNTNFSNYNSEEIERMFFLNSINESVNKNFKTNKSRNINKESFFGKLNHYQT
jgi:hypothetical protein